MPAPVIGAVAAPFVGAAAGKLFGPKQQTAQAAVPQDLKGLRGNQLDLLNYLTGFGGAPAGLGNQPAQPQSQGLIGQLGQRAAGYFTPRSQGDASQVNPNGPPPQPGFPGGPTVNPGIPGQVNFGGQSGSAISPFTGGQLNQNGQANDSPINRIQSYFGGLGTPFNNLQNTAADSAQRMLTQQSPQQRALEQFSPNLGQTGLNQNATQRLDQGLNQSGLDPTAGNFFQNLLGGQQNLGPGQIPADVLAQLAQTGGNLGQGSDFQRQLQQLTLQQSQGQGGGAASGFLGGVLGQNPAQGLDAALKPLLDRNISEANLQGGRFGTQNAVLKSKALEDYNLLQAQAQQRGLDQQLQAAGLLNQSDAAQRQAQLQALGLGGSLAGLQQQGQQAGVNAQLGAAGQLGGFNQQGNIAGLQGQLQGANALGNFGFQDVANQLQSANLLNQQGLAGQGNILQGAQVGGQLANAAGQQDIQQTLAGSQIGQQLAQQAAQGNQQAQQILLALMGQAQGVAFNQPTTITPSGAQQGAQVGGGISNAILQALPYLMPKKTTG